MAERVPNAGAALLNRAEVGGKISDGLFFCPRWPPSGGRGRRGAARGSNRAFFLLTFVSGETREEKGLKSIQLQSLAGAQAKIAPVFHAGNGLLTKICLCSNPR